MITNIATTAMIISTARIVAIRISKKTPVLTITITITIIIIAKIK